MIRVAVTALLAAALTFSALHAEASSVKRSTAAKSAFKRSHPCPANGKRSGPCAGYVIDHVVPLCAGGPDKPSNMQWQSVAEAREKDKVEVKACRTKGKRR